ncbi:beta-lactamase/transpeptidase-like protein [Mycena galopus ATCC 62051]|nr:beta-lactamase/transpeptidase-like protein [Mycena galopus ATCC 62051]
MRTLSHTRANMHFILLVLALGTLAVCHASSTSSILSNGTATILTAEIDAAITSILADWNTPGGVAVAVVRLNDDGAWEIETKGYGTAQANGNQISPNTVFNIGSNSKLFDILATGLLISNESLVPQISWKTKLASVIPDWEFMDPVASSQSTITDLMSHRTGMPRHDYSYALSDDVPTVVNRLRYLKPSTGFRENTQYSNLMYSVLSYLPTALLPDKPPFARYVKAHILDPLGMNATTYSFAVANATGNLADGFAREGINVTENPVGPGMTRVLPYWMPNVTEDGNMFSGPGGVLTTAVDAARWLQMLLLNGLNPDTNATVVPAIVIQTVATGVSVWDGNSEAPELSPLVYGGGQIQSTYRGHVMIEHGGDAIGFHAQITRFPNDNFGIAVLTNDDTLGNALKEVVKFRVIDAAFGLVPVNWSARCFSFLTTSQRKRTCRLTGEIFRYQASIAASEVALPTIPALPNATQPIPNAALARKYSNPGYGRNIELCTIPAEHAASTACAGLVQQLNVTFPEQLVGADLVWAWGKVLASYVTLTHFNAGVYNVSGWIATPTVDDASASVFAYDSGLDGVTAEFDVDAQNGTVAGFRMRGGIWGAGTQEGEPTGSSVMDRAEVWYAAVREIV